MLQRTVGKAPLVNPLALATMALPHEQRMYTYEIACIMRGRCMEESITAVTCTIQAIPLY